MQVAALYFLRCGDTVLLASLLTLRNELGNFCGGLPLLLVLCNASGLPKRLLFVVPGEILLDDLVHCVGTPKYSRFDLMYAGPKKMREFRSETHLCLSNE